MHEIWYGKRPRATCHNYCMRGHFIIKSTSNFVQNVLENVGVAWENCEHWDHVVVVRLPALLGFFVLERSSPLGTCHTFQNNYKELPLQFCKVKTSSSLRLSVFGAQLNIGVLHKIN